MALDQGTVAVALINGQMTVVRGSRSHSRRDRVLDVDIFSHFGNGLFVSDSSSRARIFSKDIHAIFPSSDPFRLHDRGMFELPSKAYSEFKELSDLQQSRMDALWASATGKLRARMR
ncbi:hypothetical protein SISNIDRAFT_548931 [Sistotremastrum niveocremeum HHB9708]|uniref:Uncharacterized protein n=1 Tax=Sistotremastrum niveocremeum HHB9708 TaxID=1314777 RepID=A0A164VQ10_9AGAM|nr:hypothetical protein SISNIDRAFT_548931 [Sistotremastrum niveocremeum HHB9708]